MLLASHVLRCHKLSPSEIATKSVCNFSTPCWYFKKISSSKILDQWLFFGTCPSSTSTPKDCLVWTSLFVLSNMMSNSSSGEQWESRTAAWFLVTFLLLDTSSSTTVYRIMQTSSLSMLNLSNLWNICFLSSVIQKSYGKSTSPSSYRKILKVTNVLSFVAESGL
jgi:hypothetical protein